MSKQVSLNNLCSLTDVDRDKLLEHKEAFTSGLIDNVLTSLSLFVTTVNSNGLLESLLEKYPDVAYHLYVCHEEMKEYTLKNFIDAGDWPKFIEIVDENLRQVKDKFSKRANEERERNVEELKDTLRKVNS